MEGKYRNPFSSLWYPIGCSEGATDPKSLLGVISHKRRKVYLLLL